MTCPPSVPTSANSPKSPAASASKPSSPKKPSATAPPTSLGIVAPDPRRWSLLVTCKDFNIVRLPSNDIYGVYEIKGGATEHERPKSLQIDQRECNNARQ